MKKKKNKKYHVISIYFTPEIKEMIERLKRKYKYSTSSIVSEAIMLLYITDIEKEEYNKIEKARQALNNFIPAVDDTRDSISVLREIRSGSDEDKNSEKRGKIDDSYWEEIKTLMENVCKIKTTKSTVEIIDEIRREATNDLIINKSSSEIRSAQSNNLDKLAWERLEYTTKNIKTFKNDSISSTDILKSIRDGD